MTYTFEAILALLVALLRMLLTTLMEVILFYSYRKQKGQVSNPKSNHHQGS